MWQILDWWGTSTTIPIATNLIWVCWFYEENGFKQSISFGSFLQSIVNWGIANQRRTKQPSIRLYVRHNYHRANSDATILWHFLVDIEVDANEAMMVIPFMKVRNNTHKYQGLSVSEHVRWQCEVSDQECGHLSPLHEAWRSKILPTQLNTLSSPPTNFVIGIQSGIQSTNLTTIQFQI